MLVTRLPKRSTFKNNAAQRVSVYRFRLGRIEADEIGDLFAEFFRVNALGQPGRDGSKDIAGMKGIAHRLQGIVFGGDVADMQPLFPGIDHGEHAIVGRDKMMPVAGDQNRPPRRSHSRIDHDQMHRSGREVRIGLRNRQRAIQHIKGLHGMADIHDLNFGNDIENDAFDRPHEVIVEPKVGGQRDDRPMRQFPLARRQNFPRKCRK